MLELSPENIAVLAASAGGIGAITIGSRQLAKETSAVFGKFKILLGGIAMTAVAATGNDPRYLLPEGLIVTTAAKSYLESKSGSLDEFMPTSVQRTLITMTAVGIMIKLVIDGDIQNAQQALAPAGLATLAIAFGLNPENDKEQVIYRILSNLGAGSLVLGSSFDLHHTTVNNNTEGAIMSASFLGLNLIFLVSEALELGKKIRAKSDQILNKD